MEDVVHRINEGCKESRELKIELSNSGLGINVKKCLYESVIEPRALYIAEAWGLRSAERRKVNVLEMKCLEVWWSATNGWSEELQGAY